MCLRGEAEIFPFLGSSCGFSDAAEEKASQDEISRVVEAQGQPSCAQGCFCYGMTLWGFIQGWLKEEASLVMKGEKNLTGPWDQKKKKMKKEREKKPKNLHVMFFGAPLKLEVRSGVLSYLRMG